MARSKTQIEKQAFVRGLITEASPLTFPENASLDEQNFILNRDGSRQRRFGMDTQQGGTIASTVASYTQQQNNAISVYKWENVGNNPDTEICVVQVGYFLYFFHTNRGPLTDHELLLSPINLSSFDITNADPILYPFGLYDYPTQCDFAHIDGELFVVNENFGGGILQVSYDSVNDAVTSRSFNLYVRDIWGTEDGLDVDERPATLDDEHKYNLLNQGWPLSRITASLGNTTSQTATASTQTLAEAFPEYYYAANPGNIYAYPYTGSNNEIGYLAEAAAFFYSRYGVDGTAAYNTITGSLSTTTGYYPSNADIYSTGKKIDANGNPTYDFTLVEETSFGTTPAPKGKFILNAFQRGVDRAAKTGLTLAADTDEGRPTCVEAFSGRLFYAGVNSQRDSSDTRNPNYGSTIFFTQVIERSQQYGRCYTDADPTAEEINQAIASDGGTIKIPNANRIVRMVAKDAALIVFADNGVWAITGPDGVFKATEYTVVEITNVGTVSRGSVVVAEQNIFYWARGGIYIMAPGPSGYQVENITETTIQTLYTDIPQTARSTAQGTFDPIDRKVRWLYSDDPAYDGVTEIHAYNKELIFDIVLKAFSTYSIKDYTGAFQTTRNVGGYVPPSFYSLTTYNSTVVVGANDVEVGGDPVYVVESATTNGSDSTLYYVWGKDSVGTYYQHGFAQYNNTTFRDWNTTDATAYLITGYELFGDTQRKKGTNYLTLHYQQTEDGFTDDGSGNLSPTNESGCLVQVQWDFADSYASNKWGRNFQGYRLKRPYIPTDVNDTFDYGWSVVTTKNRLRGSGKAMSLKFTTQAQKNCHLLGWAMDIEGTTNV